MKASNDRVTIFNMAEIVRSLTGYIKISHCGFYLAKKLDQDLHTGKTNEVCRFCNLISEEETSYSLVSINFVCFPN